MFGGNGKIVYNPDNIPGRPKLDGVNDIPKANAWALIEYAPNYRKKPGSPTNSNKFEIKNESGEWIECVWHHHEDAKNMIPVPVSIHDKALSTGVAHIGGARILKSTNDLKDLVGFFPELTL